MSLAACFECRRQVSTDAAACPHCGAPHPTRISAPLRESAPAPAAFAPAPPTWHPGIAAVLSLVIPGAGQMYKGKVGVGLLWLFGTVVGYLLYIIPGLILHILCILNAATAAPPPPSRV